jgi:hypothetical protein
LSQDDAIELKAFRMAQKMLGTLQPGPPLSTPARTPPPPAVPPFEATVIAVTSAIVHKAHFTFESICKRNQQKLEQKGTASTKKWTVMGAEITASELAPGTETDCKDFSYYDMLDGWIHYIQILAEQKYSQALLRDRLHTYRWILHGHWPDSNKVEFMHKFLLAHPDTNTLWEAAINTDCNLLINTHLNKSTPTPSPQRDRPASNSRRASDSPNRPAAKRGRVKTTSRKLGPGGRNAPTPFSHGRPFSDKMAQNAALEKLQANAPTGVKLRICYASNDVNKACITTPCPFSHVCIKCAGPHIRKECKQP